MRLPEAMGQNDHQELWPICHKHTHTIAYTGEAWSYCSIFLCILRNPIIKPCTCHSILHQCVLTTSLSFKLSALVICLGKLGNDPPLSCSVKSIQWVLNFREASDDPIVTDRHRSSQIITGNPVLLRCLELIWQRYTWKVESTLELTGASHLQRDLCVCCNYMINKIWLYHFHPFSSWM